jgi:hypothetical protein
MGRCIGGSMGLIRGFRDLTGSGAISRSEPKAGEGIMEILPDDALVVRGGKNRPEDILRGMGTHPSGVSGVSVESVAGASIEDLAVAIPHGQLGVTTVGTVRQAGGDTIKTSAGAPITPR